MTYLQDIYDEIMKKIINEEQIEIERINARQKKELEKSKFCCRCHQNLENENIIKYDEEITKKGILFACKNCGLLINHWLEKGNEENSFTY